MLKGILSLIWRGITDLRVHPFAHFLTFIAVTFATFLAGFALLVFVNINDVLGTNRSASVYQLYWDTGVNMERVTTQWQELGTLSGLHSIRTYTPEQAFEELSGYARTARKGEIHQAWLAGNPLPPTAVLRFEPVANDMDAWHSRTLAMLRAIDGVERVQFTPPSTELTSAWRMLSRNIMLPLFALLGIVLSLVVGNTIKLALVSRKTEIDILRLVGAKRWYIRLPLLVTGTMQGILGGSCALALLWLAWVQAQFLFVAPPFHITLLFLPAEYAYAMLGIPALMGFVSSWVAIK